MISGRPVKSAFLWRPGCQNGPRFGERLRGNTMRGNRTESLWEENHPARRSPRGPPKTSEVMKTQSQKGTSQRFSEVPLETLLEEDFPLWDSLSCCLSSRCPLIFLQKLLETWDIRPKMSKLVSFFISDYPLTQYYSENNSPRSVFTILMDFVPSECLGKKDMLKELCVKLANFCNPRKISAHQPEWAVFPLNGLSSRKAGKRGYFCRDTGMDVRGFAKGWFPKGWFWRMFPRNENRNEGTFAKTTLLETALLSPNDPFWRWQKGGFQKGGFGGCSPGTKTGTRVRSPKPPFYETALLSPSEMSQEHPAVQGVLRNVMCFFLCAFSTPSYSVFGQPTTVKNGPSKKAQKEVYEDFLKFMCPCLPEMIFRG